jgi:hypothetical protein
MTPTVRTVQRVNDRSPQFGLFGVVLVGEEGLVVDRDIEARTTLLDRDNWCFLLVGSAPAVQGEERCGDDQQN